MGLATLEAGQDFCIDGEAYLLTRVLGTDRIEFQHRSSSSYSEKDQDELLQLYALGRLRFGPPESQPTPLQTADSKSRRSVANTVSLLSMKEDLRALTLLRLHFVERLNAVPMTRTQLVPAIEVLWNALSKSDKLRMPQPPPASTVCRWIKRWREADCTIGSLVNRNFNRGNRRRRLHETVIGIIVDCIETIYMRPERPSMSQLRRRINGMVALKNVARVDSERFPAVSEDAIKRQLRCYSKYDVYRARYGQHAARVKFRVSGVGVPAELPLLRAEIDHCLLNVFVVDEVRRLPLGRPWLTLILDSCTRMVLGYALSFDQPSGMTVMRALRHAVMPKALNPCHRNAWPTWGLMQVIVVDNGLEFHGDQLVFATSSFGVTVQTCPRRHPWYKGKVERWFGTAETGLISQIAGRTFNSVENRQDYDSAGKAVLGLETLRKVVEMWIVDVYHQTLHPALAETPQQCWNRLIPEVQRLLPDSSAWTDAAFGKPGSRTLGHEGINYDSLFYNSEEMGALRQQFGHRFRISIVINDEDVGYLYVLHPASGEPIRVPAVAADYANGMTRWQHRRCKAYALEMGKNAEDPVALAQSYAAIQDLIGQDMLLKRSKSRMNVARFMQLAVAPKRDAPTAYLDTSDEQIPDRRYSAASTAVEPALPEKAAVSARLRNPSDDDDDPIFLLDSDTHTHGIQGLVP
ncbi:hypothetical protein V3391_07670 [Luteimonas sp. SMYT11W]|uniref:Integrase catalytic domain-containing protein n=1 Tax=Luteimonas flava TaxID=3115822 RepID=A0ABU7WDP0_9GAMM